MEELKSIIAENLATLKAQTEEKECKLRDDNRDDEALIEKIKANIVDVFLSVLDVSYQQSRQAGGDEKDLIEKFNKFFEVIPENWFESKKQAEERGDFEIIYKEDAKIAMAKLIEKVFLSTVEEYNVR
ncbi:MAG: hypothetical protein AB1Z23_10005 [Eubacteriales bacterium]